MKKITLVFFALLTGTAFAQNSANASADTFAEIVAPLKISADRNLNFGRIIGGSAGGGTVTIAADDAGTRTSSSSNLEAPGVTPTSAKFTITASGYNYGIAMTDTDLTASGLTDMAFEPVNSIGTTSNGDQILYVGGTLTVGTNQEVGDYSGTVTVTVTYE